MTDTRHTAGPVDERGDHVAYRSFNHRAGPVRLTVTAGALCAAAGVIALAGSAFGATSPASHTFALPTVYQKVLQNSHLVLGPQSSPTHVLASRRLPAGTYLVTYSVGVVLGHSDNAVCAAFPRLVGGNDSQFGVAGNGSQTSGTDAAGIYGNAVETDVYTIPAGGDRIDLVCNSSSGTQGSYVGGASLTALQVGAHYFSR